MNPKQLSVILAVVLGASPFAQARKDPPASTTQPAKELSLVRVNVTGQVYDYFRPWQKKAPFSKRALGAVLSKGRVLVTADLIANENYVELEKAETGEKMEATVQVVDYEANLALLTPAEGKFLAGIPPLDLATDTVIGDRVAAWQLEPTGALVMTDGLVTTVQVSKYPVDPGQFLTYRISIPLQYRDNSFTVPIVKGGKLAGLLLRYDARSQVLDAIPATIVAHFLRDSESGQYHGFPTTGFAFVSTRDPQLRRFAGETEKAGGVYVTNVERDFAAARAGLQVGDVVIAVGDHELDQNGNYVDSLYGKIEFINLIAGHGFVGDTVPINVLRGGKPLTLNLTLQHRDARDYVIPPYSPDQLPAYYVLGGLVFQELSRQFLKEWGGSWQKDAPQRLVYLDHYQAELFPENRRRVVVLTQVLPANSTIGYDDFSHLVVTKVNNRPINGLADLAEAIKHPIDGFHKIETEEDPKQLELEAAQVEADASALQQNYGLPALQHLP